jgi:fucose permease
MHKRAAFVGLMAVFTLAVCFILIGATSEELISHGVVRDNAGIGSLAFTLFLTAAIAQIFIGPLVDKKGHKFVATSGFVFASVSILLLAYARSFNIAAFACALLGVSAMCVNTVGNTLIPILFFGGKDPSRASNLGNGFVGLAFVATPWLLVFSTKTLKIDYSVTLTFLALGVLGLALLAFFTHYPKVSSAYQITTGLRLLSRPAVLVAASALFCYVAIEMTMNIWIKPYMTELFGGRGSMGAITKAGFVLGLFGLAMAVGRFVASAFRNLSSFGSHLIAVLSGVAGVCICVMVFSRRPGVAVAAVVIAGLALAPLFPTIIGVTFAKFQPSQYGSIFGIIYAIGLTGGMVVPKIIGNLSVGTSVQGSLGLAAVTAGILLGMSFLLSKA